MDRTSTSRDKHHSSVRAVGVASLDVVLPGAGRNGRKLGAHACDRRAVSQDAVLREPQDGRNVWLQPQTDPATNGHRGDLPKTTNDLAWCRTQDLPLFTAKCGGRSSRSGMGKRYHIRAATTWFFVSGSDHGLVQSPRAQLAAFRGSAWRRWRRRSP